MASGTEIEVEVVYALPGQQELLSVVVPAGACVADAIRLSGIAERFPEERLEACPTGIWGRPAARDEPLQAGDRVELYRPLRMDPREARRQLAAAGKTMGGRSTLKGRG
ncbi:MAG: RnfH family protein [Gammaproteobacteria bacterium]|nr:RnfH family protein [Gammaproteobacteria bacterium]MDH5308733.1 RnfH family protein [Gammaproteobacteria bacterium]